MIRAVLFPILFILGFVGLAGMWLVGMSHAQHHGHGHAHGHHGHALGSRFARAPMLAARAAVAPKGLLKAPASSTNDQVLAPALAKDKERTSVLARVLQVLSPLTLFSLLLGAGAAGTAAQLLATTAMVTYVAGVLGAIAMRWFVVGPLSNVIFRFESQPAQNLEGCLLQEVRAVTRFNRKGEGLVRVQIDGRDEDVLARLRDEDRSSTPRVQKGERLVIEEIDPRRNECVVSRGELLPAAPATMGAFAPKPPGRD